jgi:S-adenosylmethionine:tRNA ribosyltransferase-isomerase
MLRKMRTADFDFELPPELIAQSPAPQRDLSRLLVLHRDSGTVEHRQFHDLPAYLRKGDVLVLNNSRVIPARLRGANSYTGGAFEILLLEENAPNDWWAMLRPAKRARVGTRIVLDDADGKPTGVCATVSAKNAEGHRRLQFEGASEITKVLEVLGEIPLPPYISRTIQDERDRLRYQTVYARPSGSIATPTAGLHFTESLLATIAAQEIEVCFLTLHVGLGTFSPVKAETIDAHVMHEERYEVPEQTARIINAARAQGRRVIAVGTTSLRVLESVARRTASSSATNSKQTVVAGTGKTRIFIYPPRDFAIANALLTNFHLPRSTLLMLVSAFAEPNGTGGRELILSAYAAAIRERYRFFSYGDAMLIL